MAMTYLSTRGENDGATYASIVLKGLAADGGLFMPATYPQVTVEDLARFKELTYAELAYEILSRFADDIPAADLKKLTASVYRADVYCNVREGEDAARITPVKKLAENLWLLELSDGPTLAFKDMAMQYLGALFEYLLAKTGQELNILGATSGDTGSAAEYAMRGRKGIRVFMLSPAGRMSAFQRAQMYTLADKNIFNIAVKGTFDDAQDIVKAVSNDHAYKAAHSIGTVNSINWARVAAQVVYYFAGYLQVAAKPGDTVDVTVPSGNFGNILAGWIAKQMGLPLGQLVVATNENDVLDEFFKTGTYRVRDSAHTYVTSSPSMDISKASNFERYIFDIVVRNPARVKELWRDVAEKGGFTLTAEEFAVIKTHSMLGAEMLHKTENFAEQPLLQTAYEIARWHHERWDGRGYPDGLKGDDIPISAQLVSMADVYDALTSERCYKKAFPHETAVQMITDGACGAFNPLLIQCLLDVQGELKQEILQW